MHIAFIAMSGVRAANPKLNEAGLTMPGFVERSRAIASLPSLSLLTLAALTPDDIEIGYHEIEDIRQVGELPACDVAAISSYSAQIKDAYEVCDRYRVRGVRTVLGGPHVTARPDEALTHADAIVTGEGELGWPELVADLRARRPLRRRYDPDGREFDLADAPLPRVDLLDVGCYNRLTVQTQRGCPWRCEFCAASMRLTAHYKVKPIDKVVAEILAITRIWPGAFVEFADDNSFVNRRHSKDLLRAIAPLRIKWFTETDVSIADDDELLELMHRAGCAEVLVGLESPTAAGIAGVERRKDWKRARFATYERAIERIQGHGIAVNGCFVLGLDGDGPDVFDAVERFVERSGQFDVQITVMTPFPGTPLYDRLLGEGRLLEPEAWERCSLFDVNFVPLQMTAETLQQGALDLARRVYTEEARAARRTRFHGQWGRARRAAAPERREVVAV